MTAPEGRRPRRRSFGVPASSQQVYAALVADAHRDGFRPPRDETGGAVAPWLSAPAARPDGDAGR